MKRFNLLIRKTQFFFENRSYRVTVDPDRKNCRKLKYFYKNITSQYRLFIYLFSYDMCPPTGIQGKGFICFVYFRIPST